MLDIDQTDKTWCDPADVRQACLVLLGGAQCSGISSIAERFFHLLFIVIIFLAWEARAQVLVDEASSELLARPSLCWQWARGPLSFASLPGATCSVARIYGSRPKSGPPAPEGGSSTAVVQASTRPREALGCEPFRLPPSRPSSPGHVYFWAARLEHTVGR